MVRKNKFGKFVYKIALTGGPCSGKTTALRELKEEFRRTYDQNEWQMFTVAEAANLLYSGGVQRSEMSDEQLYEWQKGMLMTIFQLEDVFDQISVNEEKRHTVILCDRGAIDPKVFTRSEHWTEILEELELSEGELMDRYDAIIRLETAPRDAYTVKNNVNRRETYENACKLSQAYFDIWKDHPHLFSLDDSNLGWSQKFEKLFSVFNQTLDNKA